jgi:O-antigen ligase
MSALSRPESDPHRGATSATRRSTGGTLAYKTACILALGLVVFTATASVLFGRPVSGVWSASAVATVTGTLLAWFAWVVRPRWRRSVIVVLWPFLAFLAYAMLSFLRRSPSIHGIQNVLVIIGFIGMAMLSAQLPTRGLRHAWLLSVPGAAFAVLYVCSLVGADAGLRAISGRVLGILVLPGYCWLLARGRYRLPRARLAALALAAVVAVSLSRMALVAMAVAFVLSRYRPRKPSSWAAVLSTGLAMAVLMGLAVTYVQPLRARFFQGDLSMSIGRLSINAMGRTRMWTVTWRSFLLSPWLGHGPGAAQEVINASMPNLEHPHNDYLRLLHDYGAFGCSLWVAGMTRLFLSTWRAWVASDRSGWGEAPVHLAAVLGIVVLAVAMITDNPLAYFFVMAPLGALLGLSVGVAGRRRQREASGAAGPKRA